MNSTNPTFLDIPQEVFDILTDDQIVALVKKEYAKQHAEPVVTIEPVADEKPPKKFSRNCPIWEMKKFDVYSTPRTYNPKTGIWRTKRNMGKPLYLPFDMLIEVIMDYRAGIDVRETHRKLQIHKTAEGVRNAQCIYRGGDLMMESLKMPVNMVIILKTLFQKNARNTGGV